MHRSPLSVLLIFAAAMAACSAHDDTDGAATLAQDSTLVAHLGNDKQPQQTALPGACGAITVSAQPAVANKREADDLTRKAYDAEMLGNVQEARTLLRRATQLDATNKSAAYHLGLTSETLGDRAAAISAYCRYLTLTPTTAESVEARQRVAKLSQVETRVAAGSVGESSPAPRRASNTAAPRVPREARTVQPRVVASAPARESASAPATERGSPTSSDPVATSPSADRTADASTAGSDGASSASVPSVDQPPTPARTERRGPGRTQSAIIGAAAGAIIGGATGRSVKGAVIGGAAGGILGTIVGGTIRPAGPGIGS